MKHINYQDTVESAYKEHIYQNTVESAYKERIRTAYNGVGL